jgi:hypothetical protein
MSESDDLYEALKNTIALRANPEDLRKKLAGQWRAIENVESISGDDLFNQVLEKCHSASSSQLVNDPTLYLMQNWIIQLDAIPNPSWSGSSAPNTLQRRNVITELLGIRGDDIERFNKLFEPFLDGNISISTEHEPWYTEDRKNQDAYYWPSILDYLKKRGIPEESIISVDQASDQILDFIADPKKNEIRAARGLVVGYVQSGKTTNINVLISKSVDAGYRLIIVLAGLTDVLRTQTQRRLDKEVVGKSLIATDRTEMEGDGYMFNNDWADFIEHLPQPGKPDGPPIERLTTRRYDFSQVKGGARFENDWAISGTSARVVVIKKNVSRLNNLIQEIEKMDSSVRQQLPVIVIDDESDQASVNTNKLIEDEETDRSKTNQSIVDLLLALPRAQYIGYTATPFANVFINPDDPTDLFPHDFVYSLTQPLDYMGVRDFHDLDDDFLPIKDISPEDSNKQKYVRDILSSKTEVVDKALRSAIDSHVVSGAIKLYRETTLNVRFRHHTFFLTDSTRIADHEEARKKIVNLWENSNFHSSEGLARLGTIYREDILQNSNFKNDSRYFPEKFDDLRQFIEKAIQRMNKPFDGYAPTLIVNGSSRGVSPDFEMDEIWKFVVGGAKLSRGYTIEGLTTTFFRRRTASQDTLLQMGRWFGYRKHYQDLVRLYISRSEGAGARSLDLYKAFEAVCRDEEAFRQELRRYAVVQPDGSRLTPRDIPPLVQNSHPQLMPVQPNKMWNAKLTSRNFGGQLKTFEGSSIDASNLEDNASLVSSLFNECAVETMPLDEKSNISAWASVVSHEYFLNTMLNIKKDFITPQEVLFRDFLQDPKNEIKDWVLLFPQLISDKSPHKWTVVDDVQLKKVGRTWNAAERSFGPVGERRHRYAAYEIAGIVSKEDRTKTSSKVHELASGKNRAVILIYPIYALDSQGKSSIDQDLGISPNFPPIGMEYFLPENTMPAARFEPIRRDLPDELVVDRPNQ